MGVIAFLVTICGSSWGIVLSCLTADPQVGLVLCPLFLDSFPECFSGVLQPLVEIKPIFRWLAYFTPHSYAAEITAELEFDWVRTLINCFPDAEARANGIEGIPGGECPGLPPDFNLKAQQLEVDGVYQWVDQPQQLIRAYR